MAAQYSATVRSATLDSIQSTIGSSPKLFLYTGSIPSSCSVAATAGTNINPSTFQLPSTWMAAASSGTKSINGIWALASNTSGTVTIGYFRIFPSSATDAYGIDASIQGTVTATGGGGDMTLDSVSVSLNQVITITGFTLTAGGA